VPHADELGAVHVDPAQQPLGHEIGSQTQAPPEHRCPAPHAGPPSHRQTPPTHESAVEPQATHAAPPVPHADALGAVHVDPAQQPLGHDVASQTQTPPEHRCPAPHAGPPPHSHIPFTHESALEPHARQTTPPIPQVKRDGGTQIES
jgi:hypothetical protein